MNNYSHYLRNILTAPVYDIAIKTPLDHIKILSNRLDNNILLKREDLQPVFSFKLRGAYACMAKLSQQELNKGVITASAGNHAQGVALSAKTLGCKAIIVMPVTTPQIKIDAVKNLGGEVVLSGNSFSDAYQHAMQLVAQLKITYIPPFDHEDVIVGQGTIAMEILQQHPKPIHAIFVPIGGGGLAAGIAVYIKNVRPDIKVIGVQTKDSSAMSQSIQQQQIVNLADVGLFSDGTAVKQVGSLTYQLCKDLLDEIILVDTDAICAAIKDIFDDTRSIAEPAGALSLAGLKEYIKRNNIQDQTLIAVNSGANMNFHRLRHVSERSELTENKEAIFAVSIPEQPGSFLNFINILGKHNITEFNYRYGQNEIAHIFVGIQTNGKSDVERILQNLQVAQLPAIDLTDNEMAKIHIRYMVGGRTDKIKNEQVLSFQFPECPGALASFLTSMRSRWSITLFHYRNHGSDYGRVMIGIEVLPQDMDEFKQFLISTGYIFTWHTDNPAYQLFLTNNNMG